MIKCSICETEIIINPQNNEKNIGILKDNKYFSIACDDAILFLDDNIKIKKDKVQKKRNVKYYFKL